MYAEHSAVQTRCEHARCKIVLGMALETRICDKLDFGAGLKPLCQGHGILTLTLHSERKSADAADRQP